MDASRLFDSITCHRFAGPASFAVRLQGGLYFSMSMVILGWIEKCK